MNQIFDDYYEKIYYWALNKTNNISDAEDLTNDIFLAVFKYVNKNIDIKKLDNLIWKIAHNLWNKKAIIYIKEKNNIDIEEYKEGTTKDNIEKIIYKEIIDNIDSFNLTEKEKKAFELYYYKDLSLNEIINIMKTSTSNIKYYLYSARNKIKERYYE